MDYNDGLLERFQPTMRLGVCDKEYGSIETGDGTGYVRLDYYQALEELTKMLYEDLEKWEAPPNKYLDKQMRDLGLLEDHKERERVPSDDYMGVHEEA